MAFLSKLRFNSSPSRLTSLQTRQLSSSILNPNSTTPLSSLDKSRAALSLLKSEKNPERIIDICRAASLSPDTHLDRIVFSQAISKLVHLNCPDGIRLFLQECQTRPDLRNERFASRAMVLYGEAGLLEDAFKVFDKMPELGIERTVKSLNALLLSCIVSKNYSEVQRVFLEFPKKYGIEPNLDTYNKVVKSYCESGGARKVYSVLDEMDRKLCKVSATTFGTWISGFYKEEKFDEVEVVLGLMRKRKMSPGITIYNVMIQSLCKLKKSGEAKALLEDLLSRSIKPNGVTYGQLICGFCKEGNLEEAKKLFREMTNGGFKPDSYCYFNLLYYLCRGGDFETALPVCKESIARRWIPNLPTMKLLVNGLVSISKVDEARELVGQMKEKFGDTWNEIEAGLPK